MASVSRKCRFVRQFLAGMLAMACVGSASVAYGQATLSEQTLDRVDVIAPQSVTNVAVDAQSATKPWVGTNYAVTSNVGFTACQNTPTRGLYCLDGNVIRHWPNHLEKSPPETPVLGTELFNCTNGAFGFDKDYICSALTVDLGGNIWLAGKKKSKYSLFKVIPRACAGDELNSGWKAVTAASCAREYALDRPVITDLTVVDGDVAASFPYGEGGVIGVEGGIQVTFFSDSLGVPAVTLGVSKVWGLSGNEKLQTATLLQKAWSSVDSRNWIVVVTSTGRLLSREVPWDPAVVAPVINHTAPPVNLVSTTSCGPTALYDARASVKTHTLFVSDRRGCRLLSLQSNVDASSVPTTTPLAFTSQDVIASTAPTSAQATLTASPAGISIASGIEVDLRAECGPGLTCAIVPDGADQNNVEPAASLSGVHVDDGPSGLTVFQIHNIPHCPYFAVKVNGVVQPAECNGAMLTADGSPVQFDPTTGKPLNPESLFLDIYKLMPPEVTSVVSPRPMLLSPRYKALDDTNTFDAVFGITEDQVRFRETFLGNFDLGDLLAAGRKLGCGGEPYPPTTTAPPFHPVDSINGADLDILVTISERFTTVGGLPNGTRQYTDMLVNKQGCTPDDPPLAGTRWSLYAYGLKMAPDKRIPGAVPELQYSDSLFAKLVLSLFKDLGATIDDYLCFDRDGGNGAPVSATTCATLQSNFGNTLDKLIKCVQSSTDPMTPSGIRTCQGFESQYRTFAALVNGLTPNALDLANRIGEGKARLEVFRYMYDYQFKPSIPPTGFVDGL